MMVNIPNPPTYPSTISYRLSGVASNRSSVPVVLSLRKETPAIRNTKKKMKNPISIGPNWSMLVISAEPWR
ncbi:hypothetical protein D3C81_1286090 [compost metagenome]